MKLRSGSVAELGIELRSLDSVTCICVSKGVLTLLIPPGPSPFSWPFFSAPSSHSLPSLMLIFLAFRHLSSDLGGRCGCTCAASADSSLWSYMTNTRAICLTISIDVHLICKNLIKVLFIKKNLVQFNIFFKKYPKGIFQLGPKCQKTLSDFPPPISNQSSKF